MPAKYPKCNYCGRSFETLRATQVHCSHHNIPKGPKPPGAPVLGRDYTMEYNKPEPKQDYYHRKKAGMVIPGRGNTPRKGGVGAKAKRKYTKRAKKPTNKAALSKLLNDAMAENRSQVVLEMEVVGLPPICLPITLGTPYFERKEK